MREKKIDTDFLTPHSLDPHVVFTAGGKGPGQYTSDKKLDPKPGERVIITGKREVPVRQPVIQNDGFAPRDPHARGRDRVPSNKKG